MPIEWKSKSDEYYKTLEAHRGWHKCRGKNCDEAKRLRAIWNSAVEKEEKDGFQAESGSITL